MTNKFDRFINWLSTSSVDIGATALTVKGLLLASIGTIIAFLQLLHINWTVDQATQEIQAGFVVVGVIISMIGLIRKIILTMVGKNQAINQDQL